MRLAAVVDNCVPKAILRKCEVAARPDKIPKAMIKDAADFMKIFSNIFCERVFSLLSGNWRGLPLPSNQVLKSRLATVVLSRRSLCSQGFSKEFCMIKSMNTMRQRF